MSVPEQAGTKKPWSHTLWPPVLILFAIALGPSLLTLARRGSMPADPYAFLAQRQVGQGEHVVKRLLRDEDLFAEFLRATEMHPEDPGAVVTSTPLEPEDLAGGGLATVLLDVRGRAPLSEFPLQAILDELSAARPAAGIDASAPYSVEVVGAGMDTTVLRTSSLRPPSGAPMSLVLRDLTLVCADAPLVDAPDRPLLLRMQHCRIVGFDGGADSVIFRGRALAVSAESCEFLGGFGSSPGTAKLFDVRTSALIARIEDGLLRNLDLGLGSLSHGSGVRLEDVVLDQLRSRPLKPGSLPGVRYEFDGCLLGDVSPVPPPARSLSELPGVP